MQSPKELNTERALRRLLAIARKIPMIAQVDVDVELDEACIEADAALSERAAEQPAVERYRWLEAYAHWEDERDFGPGGRWWVSVPVPKGCPTFAAAIDAARSTPTNSPTTTER